MDVPTFPSTCTKIKLTASAAKVTHTTPTIPPLVNVNVLVLALTAENHKLGWTILYVHALVLPKRFVQLVNTTTEGNADASACQHVADLEPHVEAVEGKNDG